LLALETDIAAAVAAPGEIGFRVLLANTVDSFNPALTSNYPPAPQALDAGQFGRWPNPPFPIAWLRSPPIIANQRLYCVVRSTSPLRQVAALFEEDGVGRRPADHLQRTLRASIDGGGPRGGKASGVSRAFSASDMPRAAVADAVAVFALVAEAAAVRQQAEAGLARLQALAQPIKVRITRLDYFWWAKRTAGPYPFANVSLKMKFDQGPDIAGKTDAHGMLEIDASLAGRRLSLDVEVPPAIRGAHAVTIGTVLLELAKINLIEIKTQQQGPPP
jgi:hypothetical protein